MKGKNQGKSEDICKESLIADLRKGKVLGKSVDNGRKLDKAR